MWLVNKTTGYVKCTNITGARSFRDWKTTIEEFRQRRRGWVEEGWRRPCPYMAAQVEGELAIYGIMQHTICSLPVSCCRKNSHLLSVERRPSASCCPWNSVTQPPVVRGSASLSQLLSWSSVTYSASCCPWNSVTYSASCCPWNSVNQPLGIDRKMASYTANCWP